MLRQIFIPFVWLPLSIFPAISPRSTLAQSQPEILPSGMAITPLAQPGTHFQLVESRPAHSPRFPRRHGGDYRT
jgi:hypothetical protein